MRTSFTWRFPSIIGFFSVPKYLNTLEKSLDIDTIILDLSRTNDIHSAFIAFLIFAMDTLRSNNKNVIVKMSPYIKRTITMLGMNDYFQNKDAA